MRGARAQVVGATRIVYLEAGGLSKRVVVDFRFFGLDAVVATSAHRIEQVFTVNMLSRSGRKFFWLIGVPLHCER